VREHADRWFFKCVHGVSPFGFLTRNFGPQKNRRPNQDRRSMKSEEKFLFGLVTRTSLGVSAFANHRGISPSLVGTLTRLMRPQEFLMLLLLYYKSPAIPSRKCVIKSNQSGPASRGTGSKGHRNRRLHAEEKEGRPLAVKLPSNCQTRKSPKIIFFSATCCRREVRPPGLEPGTN
jgi:hypothetical protein